MKFWVPAALALTAASSPAMAAYTFQVSQSGANVLLTGSGSLNLDGFTTVSDTIPISGISGADGLAVVGTSTPRARLYTGITGPANFGTGSFVTANSVTGLAVGINVRTNRFFVDPSYVSGAQFGTSTATFNNTTIAALGLNPGSYVYSFGTGANADTITVQIGSAVPEPATWAMMTLGFGLVGSAMRRRSTKIAFA